MKADLPFALEKLTLSHRAMFSGHFCGLYLNCNDVDCTHGMTSHLIVNFFSRVDSRIVFVLSRVEISCWLCLRDFCVGIQILFRVLLRALTCVLDLCRLVRSSCCFCCASDDFVEPCMLSSRSACAASSCTNVMSVSRYGGDLSREIEFWFQKYLFLRLEMRFHFWLQFFKQLQ